MSTSTIDEGCALVLIDLQNGILALPTLVDPDDFKDRTRRLTLAAAFRANALPAVGVKLAWSADEVIFRPVEPSSPADR